MNVEDIHRQAASDQALPRAARAAARDGEHLQTPRQLECIQAIHSCINCLLCYAACPQYGLNPDFLGPAALALLHRYNADSRDGGKDERADVVQATKASGTARFVGACSEVCPKQVDPAAAIQQTKISASLDWFKARLMPGAHR